MAEAQIYQLDDYRNRPSPEEQRTKHLQARLAQLSFEITTLESERDRIIKIIGDTGC